MAVSFLLPWRWLLFGLIAAALITGVLQLDKSRQSIGYDRAVAEYTAQALKADQAARAREQALQAKVTKAQDDSKLRETKLSADAAAARRAVSGLRDDLAAIRASLPNLARDAIERYADTASVVFQECADQYSALAAKVDAINSERQTLIDAWPR
jgi:seryl-tRNA synthetase